MSSRPKRISEYDLIDLMHCLNDRNAQHAQEYEERNVYMLINDPINNYPIDNEAFNSTAFTSIADTHFDVAGFDIAGAYSQCDIQHAQDYEERNVCMLINDPINKYPIDNEAFNSTVFTPIAGTHFDVAGFDIAGAYSQWDIKDIKDSYYIPIDNNIYLDLTGGSQSLKNLPDPTTTRLRKINRICVNGSSDELIAKDIPTDLNANNQILCKPIVNNHIDVEIDETDYNSLIQEREDKLYNIYFPNGIKMSQPLNEDSFNKINDQLSNMFNLEKRSQI